MKEFYHYVSVFGPANLIEQETYRGLLHIPAMDLHWAVIAALSDWERSHLWTDARFIVKPIKPPLVLESLLAVCSIV